MLGYLLIASRRAKQHGGYGYVIRVVNKSQIEACLGVLGLGSWGEGVGKITEVATSQTRSTPGEEKLNIIVLCELNE